MFSRLEWLSHGWKNCFAIAAENKVNFVFHSNCGTIFSSHEKPASPTPHFANVAFAVSRP